MNQTAPSSRRALFELHITRLDPFTSLVAIEKAVNLENMRPSYRFASQSVHANPTGLAQQLGDSRMGPLVAGPSNWGLVDPAISTAMSLMIATLPVVETRAPTDNIVYTQVFMKFMEDIKTAFYGVKQGMQDREAARRDQRTKPSVG